MIYNDTLKDNNTATNEFSSINYDTHGAMIYIIVVLLWYSIGIIFLLGMDTLSHSEEIEDLTRHRTRFHIKNLRDHTNTKEILEELVDKQKRNRLWNIYLGTTSDTKDHLTRAETIRIRHIEKQLATIKRNHRLTHDKITLTKNDKRHLRSRSDYRSEKSQISSEETSTTLRRRSSFDQQTIDRWKEFNSLSKPSEQQLPWAIRKLTIRKYFRRINSKKLPRSQPIIRSQTTINSFPKLSHGRTESDLSTTPSINNERQNPYLSYFHIPTGHQTIFTPEFFLP